MKTMRLLRASVVPMLFGPMALGWGTAALWAQSKPINGVEAGAKVAAINMRTAIANTAEGKQAATQIETEFVRRRKELEDLNRKLSDLQQRLTAGASTLSDEEKQRLTLEGQRLTRQLERRQKISGRLERRAERRDLTNRPKNGRSPGKVRAEQRVRRGVGQLVAEHASDVRVGGHHTGDSPVV
jgi:Skp family chaperone for outer membrane proteins